MNDKKYKYIAVFSTLLSMCSLGATGYLYYRGYNINKHVNILSEDNQTAINRLWVLERNFNQSNQNNTIEIASIESSITNITTKINQLSSNRTQIIRYEINYFINLASQSLLVYHDITNCSRFLNYANNYLDSVNDPIFNKLKYAISHDISVMQQVPKIDKSRMSAKLDSINQRIQSLMFSSQNISRLPVTVAPVGLWNKFVYNLKNTLFSLVKVSKTTSNKAILLPEEEYITRSQIRLDLLNARLSLLSNDNTNWNSSLNSAIDGIIM